MARRTFTAEQQEEIAAAKRGKKRTFSAEHRANISAARRRGRPPKDPNVDPEIEHVLHLHRVRGRAREELRAELVKESARILAARPLVPEPEPVGPQRHRSVAYVADIEKRTRPGASGFYVYLVTDDDGYAVQACANPAAAYTLPPFTTTRVLDQPTTVTAARYFASLLMRSCTRAAGARPVNVDRLPQNFKPGPRPETDLK